MSMTPLEFQSFWCVGSMSRSNLVEQPQEFKQILRNLGKFLKNLDNFEAIIEKFNEFNLKLRFAQQNFEQNCKRIRQNLPQR